MIFQFFYIKKLIRILLLKLMQVMPTYKINFIESESLKGYVKLPKSILDDLSDVENELLFKITSKLSDDLSNEIICGVEEFIDEEFMEIPKWMMENLMYPIDNYLTIELVKYIPPGKYIELEPLEKEFFNIPSYDFYLEQQLSFHPILKNNSILNIKIDDKNYKVKINKVEINFELVNFNKLIDYYVDKYIYVINTDLNVNIINNFLEKEDKNIKSNTELNKNIDSKTIDSDKITESKKLKVGGKNIEKSKLREYYAKFYNQKK